MSKNWTKVDKEAVQKARTKARRNAEVVSVKAHVRSHYRLNGKEARQARWFDVESAVSRLCKDFDRNGKSRMDKSRMAYVISLLEDTFGG